MSAPGPTTPSTTPTTGLPTFADEVHGPWSRRSGVLLDIVVVVLLLLVVVIGFRNESEYPWAVLVFSVLQVLPLLVRRVRPAWCVGLLTVASLAQLPFTPNPIVGQLAVPVAVYSAAAYGGRRISRAALALGLLGAVVGAVVWSSRVQADRPRFALVVGVGAFLVVVASWTIGALATTRQAYVEQLIDRGVRLEREAAQRAELAAADERARIAREMHDVVAHGLSVMVVQADGARYQLDQDPERVGRALDTISATGRESLTQMRQLLGLLRSDVPEPGVAPQPGLSDLHDLVAQDHGVAVLADVADGLPEVPAGVGLAAYRVVQEALTNVRKHAGPEARAEVVVHAAAGSLELVVRDDGRGAAAPDDGAGHGLVGMRERVAVHGGTLAAGPCPRGGYEVRASLPYAATGETTETSETPT